MSLTHSISSSRRFFRTPTRLILSACVAVSMLGVGMVDSRAASPRAMTKVSLVLKWAPQAQFAGYYVALNKGYYAHEGLALTIHPGGPNVLPEQVVESGAATFGLDWLPSLLAQREHGQNLVNIAQIFQTTGMRLMFGPAKSKGIGYMDPASYDRTVRISMKYGVIKTTPSGAYDQSYWSAAVAALAKSHQLMSNM